MDRLPSRTEVLMLELLVEHGEMYGLQLVATSGGMLKRGTVYVTLGRMQEKGLLTSRQEELPAGAIGLPPRLYKPTPKGILALAAAQAVRSAVADASDVTPPAFRRR
jgi:PadR family transcriptional regulator PadR